MGASLIAWNKGILTHTCFSRLKKSKVGSSLGFMVKNLWRNGGKGSFSWIDSGFLVWFPWRRGSCEGILIYVFSPSSIGSSVITGGVGVGEVVLECKCISLMFTMYVGYGIEFAE